MSVLIVLYACYLYKYIYACVCACACVHACVGLPIDSQNIQNANLPQIS